MLPPPPPHPEFPCQWVTAVAYDLIFVELEWQATFFFFTDTVRKCWERPKYQD